MFSILNYMRPREQGRGDGLEQSNGVPVEEVVNSEVSDQVLNASISSPQLKDHVETSSLIAQELGHSTIPSSEDEMAQKVIVVRSTTEVANDSPTMDEVTDCLRSLVDEVANNREFAISRQVLLDSESPPLQQNYAATSPQATVNSEGRSLKNFGSSTCSLPVKETTQVMNLVNLAAQGQFGERSLVQNEVSRWPKKEKISVSLTPLFDEVNVEHFSPSNKPSVKSEDYRPARCNMSDVWSAHMLNSGNRTNSAEHAPFKSVVANTPWTKPKPLSSAVGMQSEKRKPINTRNPQTANETMDTAIKRLERRNKALEASLDIQKQEVKKGLEHASSLKKKLAEMSKENFKAKRLIKEYEEKDIPEAHAFDALALIEFLWRATNNDEFVAFIVKEKRFAEILKFLMETLDAVSGNWSPECQHLMELALGILTNCAASEPGRNEILKSTATKLFDQMKAIIENRNPEQFSMETKLNASMLVYNLMLNRSGFQEVGVAKRKEWIMTLTEIVKDQAKCQVKLRVLALKIINSVAIGQGQDVVKRMKDYYQTPEMRSYCSSSPTKEALDELLQTLNSQTPHNEQ